MAAFRCMRAILALAILLALACPWICMPAGSRLRRTLPVAGWRVLLAGFGIRIRCHGSPPDPANALIVANHVSWTDIVVLGRLVDAGFVAKAEVANWPVIGPLARRYGCLFIARESRAAAHRTATEMNAYRAGSGLVLFAEGTTGDGDGVLPFHSSLFVTGARWPRIQPVTLAYARADGSPLSPQERRRVAWIGDDALLTHAMALAAAGGVTVDVWFEESFTAQNRKQAAEESRRLIADRLAQAQAATLKRAA
ncbi:1-acyl-sn-glycerol-3-phosphate acyltransferase [Novosphingobium sp. G106]|uniref:lysophospholipid acyltransferase family protein n=1 Tax=Novosphingobium sp. G106 TaxID=2849500 RepID=UPI001C2DE48B|nr:lysophospholipid acyltransferase family protein [Novosphingobium sp. G106]MBV1690542.1 1-acyl-sn-glycerol-3-phosphate acyltransferase [Novosphingobium sp. G106]